MEKLQEIRLSWFDIRATVESGQCFRWRILDDTRYMGWIGRFCVEVEQKQDAVLVRFPDELSSKEVQRYFDEKRNYSGILAEWTASEDLGMIVDRWGGIRILRQPLDEMIISFILSQNNNIPRIQTMIERFCTRYGEPVEMTSGDQGFAFPQNWDQLEISEADLRFLGFGYRAKYVAGAIQVFQTGEYTDIEFSKLTSLEQEAKLLDLLGVGKKVAACIRLFGLGDFSAFPMDVWVLRIMRERYLQETSSPKEIEAYAENVFGENRGYIQQLLFHEYRMREREKNGSES
ncbi:DNA glycosylase [Gottschalkiaceae bacterium SANA]|nr:DNA glycosylase [Gottschalkiaceae bacterium SANA]